MAELVVSIDCMSGAGAPCVAVGAAELVLGLSGDVRVLLVGDEEKVRPMQGRSKLLLERAEVVHASGVIPDDMKPSVAMRSSSGTSMKVALEQVKAGRASCMVAAGNTGALMALSLVILRTVEGLDRPAILVIIPGTDRRVVLLDVGANVNCNSRLLTQFASLGCAWSQQTLAVERPSVALLNIGSEENKGNDIIREAAGMMRDMPFLNFVGYVEPGDVVRGAVDVVVCDGLVGNVMLKSFEAVLGLFIGKLRSGFASNLYTKFVGGLARPIIKKGFKVFDAENTRGGIIAGLNGVVIKSHGSSDVHEYARAILSAIDAVQHDVSSFVSAKVQESNRALEEA